MRSPTQLVIASVVAIAMTSGALSGIATVRAEVSASDKETARNQMDAGREKRDAGDHQGALQAFMAADAIMHVTTTGLEVARELEALGRLTEARDKYLAVARIAADPKEPKPFTEARTEAEQLADALAPRIPTLALVITGVPAGTATKVTIDGTDVAPATIAVPRKIDPGAHVIVVSAGAAEKRAEVTLAESEKRDVTIAFADADFTATSPTGSNAAPTTVDTAPTPHRSYTLAYIGFGVAGAGIIAGTITGLMSMSKTSSLKSSCPDDRCPPSTHSDYDSAKSLATISTISFIVGGIGAGVGIVGLLSGGGSKPESTTTTARAPNVDVWISGGMAGVVGAF